MIKPTLDTPCVEWTGFRNRGGYGRFQHNGKMTLAHRAAYAKHHGITVESIGSLQVRHKCDNRGCVNPDHLELGTNADNVRDRMERGRHHTVPSIGEAHGCAKLTEKQVSEIRSKYVYRSSDRNQVTLAREYGVSQGHITKVIRGAAWSHTT